MVRAGLIDLFYFPGVRRLAREGLLLFGHGAAGFPGRALAQLYFGLVGHLAQFGFLDGVGLEAHGALPVAAGPRVIAQHVVAGTALLEGQQVVGLYLQQLLKLAQGFGVALLGIELVGFGHLVFRPAAAEVGGHLVGRDARYLTGAVQEIGEGGVLLVKALGVGQPFHGAQVDAVYQVFGTGREQLFPALARPAVLGSEGREEGRHGGQSPRQVDHRGIGQQLVGLLQQQLVGGVIVFLVHLRLHFGEARVVEAGGVARALVILRLAQALVLVQQLGFGQLGLGRRAEMVGEGHLVVAGGLFNGAQRQHEAVIQLDALYLIRKARGHLLELAVARAQGAAHAYIPFVQAGEHFLRRHYELLVHLSVWAPLHPGVGRQHHPETLERGAEPGLHGDGVLVGFAEGHVGLQGVEHGRAQRPAPRQAVERAQVGVQRGAGVGAGQHRVGSPVLHEVALHGVIGLVQAGEAVAEVLQAAADGKLLVAGVFVEAVAPRNLAGLFVVEAGERELLPGQAQRAVAAGGRDREGQGRHAGAQAGTVAQPGVKNGMRGQGLGALYVGEAGGVVVQGGDVVGHAGKGVAHAGRPGPEAQVLESRESPGGGGEQPREEPGGYERSPEVHSVRRALPYNYYSSLIDAGFNADLVNVDAAFLFPFRIRIPLEIVVFARSRKDRWRAGGALLEAHQRHFPPRQVEDLGFYAGISRVVAAENKSVVSAVAVGRDHAVERHGLPQRRRGAKDRRRHQQQGRQQAERAFICLHT